jgi:hypothetical protein
LTVLLSSALACCRWELERRHMTPPSSFALRIIVEENCKLVRTLNANYAGAAPDGAWRHPSATRCSMFWDCILPDASGLAPAARKLPGGNWPTPSMECSPPAGKSIPSPWPHSRVSWPLCQSLLVSAMWQALVLFVLVLIMGCQHRRPDFMTRVMEDCAAGDQWACDLLDSLAKARMGRDSIRLEDAHGA